MLSIPDDYSSKRLCYIPIFNPYPTLNQRVKLNHIPQVLINIVNSFLTFREQAKFRSLAKYFNVSRPIETLDLLKDKIPSKILLRDLFKSYVSFRQLDISLPLEEEFLHNIHFFLRNPKFANVTKLILNNFSINYSNSFGYKDIKTASQDYLSVFKDKLIDLTLEGYKFDLNPLFPLVNLQSLKISYLDCADFEPLANLINLTKLTMKSSIKSIVSIASLTNLTYLNLKNNYELQFIEPIKNLIKLKHLNIANCYKVVNIKSLVNLANLKYLNLKHINTSLLKSKIDPTVITYMPRLEKLNLFFVNEFPHLRYLSHLTDLSFLSLNISVPMDFSSLLELPKLCKLICKNLEGKSFRDYKPIFLISSLTELHLTGNLDRLPKKINLPSLKILNLGNNKKLEDICSIKNLTQLEVLDLSYTSIKNLEPISQLFQLRYLNLDPLCEDLQSLTNLSNLKLLSGADFDPPTLLNFKNLEYLSISLTNSLISIPDIEPLLDLPALKGLSLNKIIYYEPSKILTLSCLNNLPDHRLKILFDNDIFSRNNNELFKILRKLGWHPKI